VSDQEELYERIAKAAEQDPVNRVYEKLGADVFDAANIGEALLARNPDERAFLALVMCAAEIDNGGFEQLFGNSSAAIAQHGIEGATRLGLPRHAALIKRAWEVWRKSSPYGRDEPDENLSELDEEWYGIDEELQHRLLGFARSTSP
jgi:hypothetical protein